MKVSQLFEFQSYINKAQSLDLIRSLKNQTITTISQLMSMYQFEEIGVGNFARVYIVKDSKASYVMRLARGVSQYRMDNWYKYADLSNTSNNYLFPNIAYNGEIINGDNKKIGIALVEYLEVGDRELYEGVTYLDFVENYFRKGYSKKFDKGFATKRLNKDVLDDFREKTKHLIRFKLPMPNQDLKSKNVGFRENGEFVLFDPIATII